MPKLSKENAINLMVNIIRNDEFPQHEKPALSDFLAEKYGLTKKQQANIEVRLDKIYSYLIGEK